jgi:hypothetical protein
MLQAWTQIDLHSLVGSRINSPENGIFLGLNEHRDFGNFAFYFDKDVVSHSCIESSILAECLTVPGFSKQVQGVDGS